MNPRLRREHGVTLIEALVAVAVMAFGMLGLVGLQATMRVNADVAKQRAEATRIAQQRIEVMRSYGSLVGYAAVVADAAAATAAGPANTNTTYTITTQVSPDVLPANRPPLREAIVTVSWDDRSGQQQQVVLTTQVAGVSPAITGGLSTAGYGVPARRVYGRDAAIPPGATNMGDGTSRFLPAGSTGPGWVFNNVTGLITRVCDAAFASCTDVNRALVTGFIQFAHEEDPPTPADAEVPPNGSFDVEVRADVTAPSATVDCLVDRRSQWSVYYCAIPLDGSVVPAAWSGFIGLRGGDLQLASSASDPDEDRHRVCRYTPEDTDTPTGGNIAHPRDYTLVSRSLANQNFLIIRAGDDNVPYTCPDDGSSPFVNTNTYAHQPPP